MSRPEEKLSASAPAPAPYPNSALSRVLLATSLLLGALLRLREVGPAFLFGDEFHSLRDMQGGYLQILTHFSETGAGLALPLMQRVLVDGFGDGHWSIRAPAWLAGLGLLLLSYPIARRYGGDRVGLITTALIAVSPLLIFYSHFARIYSLVALLAFLLFDRLERAVSRKTLQGRDWISLALLSALLPWAHPTALGFLLPVFLGAAIAVIGDSERAPRDRRRRLLQLISAAAAGGMLCGLAYLPARESVLTFLATKTRVEYYGDFNFMDVAALFAGGRAAAAVLLGLAGAAAISLLRSRGSRGAPLLLACLGPPIAVALVQPYGDAYAYARYAMPALPPLCLLIARGLDGWGKRLASGREGAAVAVGISIALGIWFAGPQGPLLGRTPQHANTYLGLLTLPAFDAPWPETPDFYRELAGRTESEREGLKIVELPALSTRTRHLYRQYQRQHGVTTLLAPLPGEFPRIPSGPYISLRRPNWWKNTGADYLVVHIDIEDEIARYWEWLYADAGEASGDDRAYLERHRRYGGLPPPLPGGWLTALQAELGPPLQRGDGLLVWSLPPTGP